MKKLIFFVLLVSFSSLSRAQSSQSLGLNTSYFFHIIQDMGWEEEYQSPEIGIVYNYFLNEKQGVAFGLSTNQVKSEFGFYNDPLPPIFITIKSYGLNYSLHYISKPKQFFIKSGFNVQLFDLIEVREERKEDLTFISKETFLNRDRIQFIPEFHLALGRDFDLGKINIRVNSFIERAFIVDNYFDFGLSVGVFYQFRK